MSGYTEIALLQYELEKLRSELAALNAENESLKRDAERYWWIPVTEKLPDPEVPVLVARVGRYYAEKTCHTGKEWLLESNHYPVTHWRVLPITPQAKADFESMIDGQKRLAAMVQGDK